MVRFTKTMFGDDPSPDVLRSMARRDFIRRAAAGSVVTAMGAYWLLADDSLTKEARAQVRPDGRPRLPPGQRVITALKPMGGTSGDPNPRNFKLKVHGAVKQPFEIGFKDLLAMKQTEQTSDVHCVTGWSMLGGRWKGVRISELAKRAGVKPSVKHVIFEAAHGYTANVRFDEAMADNVMLTYQLDGKPLRRPHGPPVRALVPDLYFWKSAKWITGVRFLTRDAPGYWEVRGYNNHADPWKEERYA